MEKNKNRDDLLAAGRKKLQQFRQKKDHKSTNNSSSSNAKLAQKAGKHQEVGNAETVPYELPVDTESLKASQTVNGAVANAATAEQVVLPATELLVTPSEGDPEVGVMEDQTPEESLAPISAGEVSGKIQRLKDLGDPPDPPSLDEGRQTCPTSDLDADCSGADQCNGSIDNGGENSEVRTSDNGRYYSGVTTSHEERENVPGPATPRLKGAEEEGTSSLLAEELDKADGNVSASERASANSINDDTVVIAHPRDYTEHDKIQVSRMEDQRDGQFLASGNDTENTSEDADASVKLGFDESQGEGTSEECLDSSSAVQDVTGIGKEGTAVPEYVAGAHKLVGEGTEGKDLCRFSTLLGSEKMGEHAIQNTISPREAVEVFLPGEGISLLRPESPISRAWHMEDANEILQRHLYLTSVTKSLLQLQVTEQVDKQVESDHKLLDEGSRFQDLVQETQEKSASIHEELDQCKAELQVMFSEKKELEVQWLSASGEIERLSARVLVLQNNLALSQKESMELSAELVDCKNLVGALQMENSKLTVQILSGTEEMQKLKAEREQSIVQIEELSGRMCELHNELELSKKEYMKLSAELADLNNLMTSLQMENCSLTAQILSGTEDINKLKAEKDFLAEENMKLFSALSEQKHQLAVALDKTVQLEGDFKETMESVDKFTEENIDLTNYLDIHKYKVKELETGFQELLSQAQKYGSHAMNSILDSTVSNNAVKDHQRNCGDMGEVLDKLDSSTAPCVRQRPSVQDDENDPNEPAVLHVLKGHLIEAEEMLQNLEKAVLHMHTHPAPLDKMGNTAASKGVSKLIQAFESKTSPDIPLDEVPLVEGERLADSDSYNSMKELMCNMRAMLKQLFLDAEMMKVFCKKEQDNTQIAREFKFECETLTIQNNKFQRAIDALGMKLTEYTLNIDNLQSQLDNTWQNADEQVEKLLNQVESLQKEVNGLANTLQKEMNIMKDAISGSTEKLDTYTGLLISGNLDASSHLTASINAGTEMIEDLQVKLKAASLDRDRSHASFDELRRSYACLSESQEATHQMLYRTHDTLAKLVRDFSGYEKPGLDSGEQSMDVKVEQLHLEDFEILIEQLSKILNERLLLRSAKGELELELARRDCYMEELNERYVILATELEENNSTVAELRALLIRKDQDFDVLNKGCLALAQTFKNWEMNEFQIIVPELVENLEVILKSDKMQINSIKQLLLHVGTLTTSLMQKNVETTEQLNLSKNCLHEAIFDSEYLVQSQSEMLRVFMKQNIIPRIMESQELWGKMDLLSAKNILQEKEMQILKGNLSKAEEALKGAHSELNSKVTELEQSDQRLSSVREKLSIAVAKGKGLIVQRDSLKQSLMEKSSELERCLQELQSKESRLCDLEAKLKSSEADRVEALESELSYIRNSATAFRDSFLQKDSVLQKIEEVVEELDLPEDFHSKDIVEKVEWLAKSVAENASLPFTDWEQKGSLGGSQTDPGFVVMDAWKNGLQEVFSPALDDLKRKFEELQGRFYGLAEQNEMLEQSLMERNDLVQKWEKILDTIDMPLQLRSMEPENRLEWLGRRISEVQLERDSLLSKIDDLHISTESLLSDLEGSQEKISDLDATLVNIKRENEFLSENLAKFRSEHQEISDRAAKKEQEKHHLQREIAHLQEKLAETFECKACSETLIEVKKLHDLVDEALLDHEQPDTSFSDGSVIGLEKSLRKLIDNYKAFSLEKDMTPDDSSSLHNNMTIEEQNFKELLDDKEQQLVALRGKIDEVSHNLAVAKEGSDAITEKYHMQVSELEALIIQRDTMREERDAAIDKYQSFVPELEAMIKQRDSLHDQLSQEEQRSASMREKLNIAVRKGKGLVQQRDSLKQTVAEINTEFDCLKKELNQRVEALQSENNLLRNSLSESENNLHHYSQTLNRLLTALYSIDLGAEASIVDPVQKMEWIGRLSHDMREAVLSSENEATKSKRAAELLVAELNEVQERAESFQEDLEKAEAALALCSRQREIAEAERSNSVSHLEQFTIACNEERKKQLGFIRELKDGIFELRKASLGLSNMLAKILSKDLNLFSCMKSSVESITELVDGTDSVNVPLLAPADLVSSDLLNVDETFSVSGLSEVDISEAAADALITEYVQVASHHLYECISEFTGLKVKLHKHSLGVDHQVNEFCRLVEVTQSRVASRDLSSETLKTDIAQYEMLIKNKENELSSMHRNISLLYEACRRSMLELENRRAQVVGKSGVSSTLPSWLHGEGLAEGQKLFNEDFIRTVADSLVTTVRGSCDVLEEAVEEKQRALKTTILDFQRELQEKDVQQNRICAELVSQIREAEAVAKKFSVSLDSEKVQVKELESQIKEMENHQKLYESRISDIKKLEALTNDYEQKIKSIMVSLAMKDQEIEGLMQALDVEESQMESLQSRNQELEQIVLQKNLALENLEVSRSKALTKLSTTLRRFDELHHFSENLLTEIENLQSQLQERDSEISFLRQEVARCTNDVLAKQETNKMVSTDLHEVQAWMVTMVFHLGGHKLHADDQNSNDIHSQMKYLDKHIPSVIAELEDLRVAAQNKDTLLDIEKGRVNELSRRAEVLEASLREKESQIKSSGGVKDHGIGQSVTVNTPDSLEVESMMNKRSALGSIAPHARGGRRINSDQVAIAIDTELDNITVDDEDDDKAHGFKSLTASKIVPRATRPIADKIDGLWVAIERLLMRQPTIRLGLILYWIVLHALLAASI